MVAGFVRLIRKVQKTHNFQKAAQSVAAAIPNAQHQ